ncbi:MAG TPA: (d)CMP kinase [Chloroflexota bacterium]|nr:(d)CMP kinase [Chloroflexota bacterium]
MGKGVAEALRCAYLDTGLMYRAVTWLALQAGIDPDDGTALGSLAKGVRFEIPAGTESWIRANGIDLGDELRSEDVDAAVSRVSVHRPVRRSLVEKQRGFASGRCAVVVGRDIGTTVLPDALVKLWVTASPEQRAKRRLRDERDPHATVGAVADRIAARDTLDAGRDVSPLRRAEEAFVLDTDQLSPEEAVAAALQRVRLAVETLSQAER